jgi:hypothetical protein
LAQRSQVDFPEPDDPIIEVTVYEYFEAQEYHHFGLGCSQKPLYFKTTNAGLNNAVFLKSHIPPHLARLIFAMLGFETCSYQRPTGAR